MSEDERAVAPLADGTKVDPPAPERTKYKSWRKKYRKMKVRFDDVMRVNSSLYKEEQKLEALAQRLQENNDQILDLLLDLNSSLSIPPHLRTNVKYQKDWADQQKVDLAMANRALYEAYEAGEYGRAPRTQFSQLKDNLESHVSATEARTLREREARVPHPVYDPADADFAQAIEELAHPSSYFSSTHEEEYLRKTDAKMGDPAPAVGSTAPPPTPLSLANMSAREIEREVELHNPQSVHNWLKKHHVNVGDGDDKSEAGASGGGGSSRKGAGGGGGGGGGGGRTLARKVGDRAVERARERDDGSPMSNITRGDGEEEEDGYDDAPAKRRSRGGLGGDDDGAYRPKGGRSGKIKRKREDSDPKGGSKKPKTSLGGVSDA